MYKVISVPHVASTVSLHDVIPIRLTSPAIDVLFCSQSNYISIVLLDGHRLKLLHMTGNFRWTTLLALLRRRLDITVLAC